MNTAEVSGVDFIQRKIIHVDMDCFFAAVEELDNPSLKGKPVAVGGSPEGRGVLCTANYEARKYGLHSAMSSAEALRRCPHLIFVRPRGKRYQEFSNVIRSIFLEYTDLMEPLSLDEAYLEVGQSEKCFGSATLMAKEIKQKIKKETGLVASAGVAPNKFLAKVASDWKKPDGLFVVSPEMACSFAQNLKLEKVPGIGKVSIKKYHHYGLFRLSDINKYPVQWLEARFGKFAHTLLLMSQGIDQRRVGNKSIRKSLGHEETYSQDLMDFNSIKEKVPFLMEELFERCERHHLKNKKSSFNPQKMFVKIKTYDFHQRTHECLLKSIPLSLERIDDLFKRKENIRQQIEVMFEYIYNKTQKPVRLLGIGFRINPGQSHELEKLGQLRLL